MPQKTENSRKIPSKFPTVFGDRALDIMGMFFDEEIHCVIRFDGRIDEKRIVRAIRLSMDQEPVLGCRFVDGFLSPHWERCDNLDSMKFFHFLETENPELEIEKFIVRKFDHKNGPGIEVLLARGKNDILCIKIDHTISDAGGFKEYLYSLAEIYRILESNPSYIPEPNLKGSRSHKQVMKHLKFSEKMRLLKIAIKNRKNWDYPKKYWKFRYEGSEPAVILRRIGSEEFKRIRNTGEKLQATINDVVVAAVFRAFHEFIMPQKDIPLRMINTADLRRYLESGRGEAICNLSGFIYMNIGTDLGETFEDTIRVVRDYMNVQKQNFIGLGDYLIMPILIRILPYGMMKPLLRRFFLNEAKKGKIHFGMTNLGVIDKNLLDFGDCGIVDVFLIPPLHGQPLFVFGLSGFRDSLTFSICCKTGKEPVIPAFLDRLVEILNSCTF
jgi:NRPS condensation-like uncharacterized protein